LITNNIILWHPTGILPIARGDQPKNPGVSQKMNLAQLNMNHAQPDINHFQPDINHFPLNINHTQLNMNDAQPDIFTAHNSIMPFIVLCIAKYLL